MLIQPANIKSWKEKIKDGVTFSQIRKTLLEISDHLTEFYKKESGIGENTILFGE